MKTDLSLAPLLPKDAQDLYRLIDKNRQALGHMVWAATATLESTIKFIKTTPDKVHGIRVMGRLAGCVALRTMPSGNKMLGYWLAQEFWGRGYATRAVSMMLDAMEKKPVFAQIRHGNIASKRVLQKNGFVVTDQDLQWQYLKLVGRKRAALDCL